MIKIWNLLSKKRRWQLAVIILLTLLSSIAEIASLSSLISFLALLSEPENLNQNSKLIYLLNLIGVSPEGYIFISAALFSAANIISAAIRMALLKISSKYTFSLGADLGNEAFRRIIYQPYKYHASKNSSEIIAGIGRVGKIVSSVINPGLQAFVSIIISFGIIFILVKIDAYSTLIAASTFIFLYLITSRITRARLRKNSEVITKNEPLRIKKIQESLGGIRDIIIDDTQKLFHISFCTINKRIREAEANNQFLAGAPRYFIESIGMILIVGLACWLSLRPTGLAGAIPILGALAMGAQKLMPHMQQIYNAWSSINSNRAQLQDALRLLAQPIPEEYLLPSGPEHRQQIVASGLNSPLISLQAVGYRYSAKGPVVLDDLRLDITRGARIGFVGKTGSGKSTLIDLIMGLLEPTSGRILIDGVELSNLNRREWQSKIAHVPQSIYLADSSIAQNIALGVDARNIDMARVQLAASKAQIDDFILKLPQQYETPVGERGVRLSGGQRQRIGLARAFYKQAEVLVLDEATSALDDQTEAEVMKTIDALGSDVTVLMIAHRLSTLSNCTLIVQMLGGGNLKLANSLDELITWSDDDAVAKRSRNRPVQ